jgi:hypothetical protein
LKPDSARKKFSMLCGIVARERVPITLQDWRKLGKVERDKVKNEIMKYFNITRADDKIRAERKVVRIPIQVLESYDFTTDKGIANRAR